MEHFLNGYLTEVNSMFKNVLVPNLKQLRYLTDEVVIVDYFNSGTFVFSIQGKELFRYSVLRTEEKFFEPFETFLLVLHKNGIDIKTEEILNCNCDYKISFKID